MVKRNLKSTHIKKKAKKNIFLCILRMIIFTTEIKKLFCIKIYLILKIKTAFGFTKATVYILISDLQSLLVYLLFQLLL